MHKPSKNLLFPTQINVSCICGLTNIPSITEIKQCTTCQNYQHLKCIKKLANISKFYECPSCQFKNLDPSIEIVDTLVSPSLISNDDLINGQSKKVLKFLHKQENYTRYKDMANQGKIPFIAVRCLRLDDNGYEHHWPLNCKMTLNRKNVLELKQAKYPPMSRPREDWPLIFSYDNSKFNDKSKHFSIKDILNENTIEFESNFKENDNDEFSYALAIHIIRVLAKGTIITRTESVKDRERLKNLLGESNNHGGNLISTEKVSLLDPYCTNTLISSPARSVFCQHAVVFDLDSFLTLNSKCKKWSCPKCGKKATRLYIDNFLLDFMDKHKGVKEVNFNFNDFTYSSISEENNNNKKENFEIIDLENENETSFLYNNDIQNDQIFSKSMKCKIESTNYTNNNNKETLPAIDLDNLLQSFNPKNHQIISPNNLSNPKSNEVKNTYNSQVLNKQNNLNQVIDRNRNNSNIQEELILNENSQIKATNTSNLKRVEKNNINTETMNKENGSETFSRIPVQRKSTFEEVSISNQNNFNYEGKIKKFLSNKLTRIRNCELNLKIEKIPKKLIIDKEESFLYKNPFSEMRDFEENINTKFSVFFESLLENNEEIRNINAYFLNKKKK